VTRIVSNRVFLLGLDGMYRAAMKRHERGELLACAEDVARVLGVLPAGDPVEGYYAEDAQLTRYFRLLRALQAQPAGRIGKVATLPSFTRLQDVLGAPIYGRAEHHGLLPVGRDPLSAALEATIPTWTIPGLTEAAYRLARDTDDISLTGLAARAQDPLVLTALRESVVLYVKTVMLGIKAPPRYVWEVDGDIAGAASQFIDAFDALFGTRLPQPTADQAEFYWRAYEDNTIVGRCVRLGQDAGHPRQYYHWAITSSSAVVEFWHPELWTTQRYLAALFGQEARPDQPRKC